MGLSSYIKKRAQSFGYAFKGIGLMFKNQPNFMIHMILAILAIVLGYLLNLSRAEFLWIIIAIGMVLSAEIFNSAIEKLTDLVQPNHNPKAGKVKDLAAAAVLISAITATIIGLIIFVPRIMDILSTT